MIVETKTETTPPIAVAGRAAWGRPEIRRMVAGKAEVAFTTGSDGATQS